ncbi:hypothetical protein [Paenibacillus sp. KS-LC4]|uniref:hypothetical protein n=1 Tax=unclassified Paenibacillus TaxID=185978 RepID=UPI0030CE8D90
MKKPSSIPSAWEHVQLGAMLADLKEEHYRTVLTLSALLELLLEKGIITLEELQAKTSQLDGQMDEQLQKLISSSLRPIQ